LTFRSCSWNFVLLILALIRECFCCLGLPNNLEDLQKYSPQDIEHVPVLKSEVSPIKSCMRYSDLPSAASRTCSTLVTRHPKSNQAIKDTTSEIFCLKCLFKTNYG
jgi:hypothetical protein